MNNRHRRIRDVGAGPIGDDLLLPPCDLVESRRQPKRAFRVRWYGPEWRPGIDGRPAWTHRWYVREVPARRRIQRLLDAGHTVELDVFQLELVRSVRWDLDDGVPF